jgi:glyoxylase-like metal-dependent hydrolase (beta-lactamase superfamily II)
MTADRWHGPWREVGDRVFVRRYSFADQDIGLILGDGAAMVIDTRSTMGQAREILDEMRSLTSAPIDVVVNTHGHSDHCFGNACFAGAAIWAQRGAVRFIEETGERQRAALIEGLPDLADELKDLRIVQPDKLFEDRTTLEVGGRPVELAYHGRAHTDHDLIVTVPDVGVVFAGDIIEEGAAPWFDDGYPLDWLATLASVLDALPSVPAGGGGPVVVPGHGDVVDRAFVTAQAADIATLVAEARAAHASGGTVDDLVDRVPFPAEPARSALTRAFKQLDGEI